MVQSTRAEGKVQGEYLDHHFCETGHDCALLIYHSGSCPELSVEYGHVQ
jgi:hypothetical protein